MKDQKKRYSALNELDASKYTTNQQRNSHPKNQETTSGSKHLSVSKHLSGSINREKISGLKPPIVIENKKEIYKVTEDDKKLLLSLNNQQINIQNAITCTLDITPIDVFHPTLEEYNFLKKNKELVALMKKKTKFSIKEIEGLLLIFHKFTCQRDVMLKDEFHDVLANTLGITDDYMAHHMFNELVSSTKMRRFITMNVWVETFSLFLRGSFEDKMKHCFRIYDNTKKGFIGKDIMYT